MKTKVDVEGQGIGVVTLGCSKNVVDSEVLVGQLRTGGQRITHEQDGDIGGARTVVINTCGFIDRAKEQSVQSILDWVARKQEGEVDRVFVTGCLSQRYRDDLIKEIPDVDGFFGTHDMPDLVGALGVEFREDLVGEREPSTESHYAYLKVSEGCNRGCSFCAIPLMRGKHVSRTLESLVDETRFLVAKGVKEVILIAQDLTYYGLDLYGERTLKTLLEQLSDVEGLEWLRLHYAYPSGFPVDVLPVIRERANICNYLDMPVQHASNAVLKRMRRAITRERTEELFTKIREDVPGIAIRSTLLVGHPGETDDDHREMMEFLERMRLDRVGAFIYSHEENTHSYSFEDDVPAEVKQQRFDEVMLLQQRISLELNASRVGTTMRTLIDRQDGDTFVGRTEYDSPEVDNEVRVHGQELDIGSFYPVNITGAEEYDLVGVVG